MTTSFADMPSWVIVAAVARIARFIQHLVEGRDESQREAVDNAIRAAEESARNAIADPRASEFADSACEVSEDAIRNGDTGAGVAALCASEAAVAVRLVTNRQELVKAAERTIEYIRRLDKPACRILEKDIGQCATLAHGLTNSDPAPPGLLDFVHRQAVHEALLIQFDRVRIIYKAGLELACNSIDHNYRLGLAAGAAAEDLVFGTRLGRGCDQDRCRHKNCGGTDFEGDAAEVMKYGWFTKRALLTVASLLEEHRSLSDRDVKLVLKGLQDG
jgi:hypothetical protein